MALKHTGKGTGTSAFLKGAISLLVKQTLQQYKSKSFPPSPLPVITLKDLQNAMMQTAKLIRSETDEALKQTAKLIKSETEELLEKKMDGLRGDILLIFQSLSAHVECIDGRADGVVENVERIEDRIRKIEDNMEMIQNDIIMLQYRNMEHALRIRGLREENLREMIAADLVMVLACNPEEIMRDIEKAYRNSWVARQRNLPRDVVIYFSRKTCCNEIIQVY